MKKELKDKILDTKTDRSVYYWVGNVRQTSPVFGNEELGFWAYNPTKKYMPLVRVIKVENQFFFE